MSDRAPRALQVLLPAVLTAWAPPARAQALVTVDVTADNHPISPLIYGMNFASAAQLQAGRIPLTRWGGNSTSRYNYQIDVTNTGSDYFFENIPGCWSAAAGYCKSPPKDPRATSGANAFLDGAAAAGAVALLTLPTLGWVAKAPPLYQHPFACGCPKSALPQQDQFDPFDSACGNGQSGKKWLACPAATTTSVAADASFARGWVEYLAGRLGAAGSARIYALDNEPNLWSSTHHDVHPARLGYDELWQRMRDTAAAVLAADPSARIAGPAEWGWPNYFCSDLDDIGKGCSARSPDRAAHGGEELVAWLLDQAALYEKQTGQRILHYLDLHYYPMGGKVPDNTRSLWDPTYSDPSWINAVVRLIPRMRDWVAQHYPGTRLLISEYDFGHHDEAVGAVTYAEVLGIFGREGLDAATAWSPPGETEAAFGAYKLFRNYDGRGGQFERQSARATSSSATLAAFAAFATERATVVLVNEAGAPSPVTVTLKGFSPQGAAQLFTGNSPQIARQPDVTPQGHAVQVTVPATSFAMLVVPGSGPALPGADLGAPALDGGARSDGAAGRGDGAAAGSSLDGFGGGSPESGGCSCALSSGGGPSRGSGWYGLPLGLLAALALRKRRANNRRR